MIDYKGIYNKLRKEGTLTDPFPEFEQAMINNKKYRDHILSRAGDLQTDNSFLPESNISTRTEPTDKKKVSTGLSSEDGSSGLQESNPFFPTEKPIPGTGVLMPKQRPIDESRSVPKSTLDENIQKFDEYNKQLASGAKPKTPEYKKVEKQVLPKAIEEQLTTINTDLIGREEEDVVPEMQYRFGPLGFKFEQTSAGDAMIVTAPNKSRIEVNLDPFMSKTESEESSKLQNFIRANSAAIPNIAKLESEYKDEKVKYKTQKEVDAELEKIQKSEKDFMVLSSDFMRKKTALDEERVALESATEQQRSTPEYLKKIEEYNSKLPELQKQAELLNVDLEGLETRKSKINKTIGKYIDMKAQQGGDVSGFFGATKNQFLGGFAKDPGAALTRFGARLTSKMFRTFDNISGEPNTIMQNPTIARQAGDSVGIKVPENVKTPQQLRDWYKSLDDNNKEKFKDAFYDKLDKTISYGNLDETTGMRRDGMIDAFREGFENAWEDKTISKEYLQKLQSDSWLAETYFSTVRSLGAIAGSPAPVRMAKFFAMNTANVLDEMNRAPGFENISENEKLGLVATLGTAQTILEEFGFRNMIGQKGLLNGLIMRVLKKNAGTVTSKSFSELLKNEIESGLARGVLTLGAGFAAEAETGAAQELSDIGIKRLYELWKGNDDLFKDPKSVSEAIFQVLDASLKEGVGSVMMTSLPAASSAFAGKGFRSMSDEQFDMFRLAANDTKIQSAFISNLMARVNAGEITRAQAKQTIDDYRKSVGLFNSLPANITRTEAQKDAMNLLREKQALTQQIDGKDNALTQPQRDRIKQIDEQLTKISENAIQEQAASEVSVQPTATISEIVAQGKPESGPVLTTEEKSQKEARKNQLEEALANVQEGATDIIVGEQTIPITEAKSEVLTLAKELAPQVSLKTQEEAPVAPKVEPIALHELEDLSEVETRMKTPLQKKVVSAAKNTVAALKILMPNVQVYLHEDENEYNKLMESEEFKGATGSRGNFQMSKNRIDINMSKANERTIPHEAAHAVLYKTFGDNKRAFKAFHRSLSSAIGSMSAQDFINEKGALTTAKKYLNNFVNRYRDESARPEEYVVELASMLTNDSVKLSVRGWRKVALIVRDFLDKATDGKIKIFENINETRDVVDFFNSMSTGFKEGKEIKEAPKSITKKYTRTNFQEEDANASKSQLITDKAILKKMTEDNEGNFLFFHVSPNKISGKIDPRFFGKNLKTGRDERPGIGISMYYTRPDYRDVGGDYGYVVKVPKNEVYPFNEDPLNLYDKAKAEFNKMYPNQAFDANKQAAFIAQEAVKNGFKMTVAKWGKELRAQTTIALKPDWFEKPSIEYMQPSVVNKKYKDVVANEKKPKSKSQEVGKYEPLPGAPLNVKDVVGPDKNLVSVAETYAKENGIDLKRQSEYVSIDPEFSKRIAQAFEEMKHDPRNPKVKEAYADLIKQTRAQYDALTKAGYSFTFFDSNTDPYNGNPWDAMRDLRKNKSMAVYGTYDGYGTEGITVTEQEENPLLEDTGLKWKDQKGVEHPVTANDLFRAVHDAFGHGLEGAGFRSRGEENAWQAHVRLFNGPAVAAITSETRGQNSWLNYGPYGDKNRTAKIEDTVFAEQKVGLMPEWTWTERKAGDQAKSKSSLTNAEAGSVGVGGDVVENNGKYSMDNGSYADVEKEGDLWYIEYIESKKQRKGDGTKIINKIISDAKEQGVKRIGLATSEGTAYGFAKKLGFKERGENEDRNDISMELAVEQSLKETPKAGDQAKSKSQNTEEVSARERKMYEDLIRRMEGTALSKDTDGARNEWFQMLVRTDNQTIMRMTETAKPTLIIKIANQYGLSGTGKTLRLATLSAVRREAIKQMKALDELQSREKSKSAILSDYRDNKRFKFSDLKYPDTVFGKTIKEKDMDTAIDFYKKIVRVFNKTFDRDLKIITEKKDGNFGVTIEYETGLTPKYFSYPTSRMGEHVIVDKIDKNTPLTSLRHELIHEMLVKNITDKFERINQMDNSAEAASIEEVQRNRAYTYSLEDVFFERVVENIERLPDNKDTFPIETYATDVVNRLTSELDNETPSKKEVNDKLTELLEGSNSWLAKNITDAVNTADFNKPLSESIEKIGKYFSDRFNLSKDILPKELQRKIFDFTEIFNSEYQGVLTRLEGKSKSSLTSSRDAAWDAKVKKELSNSSFKSLKEFKDKIANGIWGMATAENPDAKQQSDEENANDNKKALEWLKSKGYDPQPIFGKYGNSENSFFVDGLTVNDAEAFAVKFKQDSVATDAGLIYRNGKMNKRIPGKESFGPASDFYSTIKINGKNYDYQVSYDLNKKVKTQAKSKSSLASVEATAKALEGVELNYQYQYGNNQKRYNAYRQAGLVWHAGESKITKLDETKIKGGVRGDLGYGYYFSQQSKASDYGDDVTFLNDIGLKYLDGELTVGKSNLLYELKQYSNQESNLKQTRAKLDKQLSDTKNSKDFNEVSKEIESIDSEIKSLNKNAINYAKELVDYAEKYPQTTIRNLPVKGTDSQNKLFSKIMTEIGYDGMQVSDKWQLVLYPQEGLNDRLVDQNQFTAEAYHQAKQDGSNPELVKAVESVLKDTDAKSKSSLADDQAKKKLIAKLKKEANKAMSKVIESTFDTNIRNKRMLEIQQVLADKINEVKGIDVKSKSALLNDDKVFGYTEMMKNVQDIITRMTVSRGYNLKNPKNRAEVLKSVMGYVEKSDAYTSTDGANQEIILREVRKMLGYKEKSAPGTGTDLLFGIGRIFKSIKENKMVTLSERNALREMIKAQARGANSAKNAMNLARKNAFATLRALSRPGGQISVKQASAILRRFATINMFNQESIDRFIDYTVKVFNDADYAAKLKEANKLRSSIISLSGNNKKDINLTTLGRQFAKIDPSMVEDLNVYKLYGEMLAKTLKGTTVKRGDVKFLEQVADAAATNSYINARIEEQNKKLREYLEDEVTALLAELGVVEDTSRLTYKDLQDIKDSLTEGQETTTKYNESMVRDLLNRMFSINAAVIDSMFENEVNPITGQDVQLSEEKKAIVRQFMAMNLNNLSVKLAIQSVDALANFIQNGSIARMADVLSSHNAIRNGKVLVNNNVKSEPLRKLWAGPLGRGIAYLQKSLPSLFENMFVGEASGAKVMKAMGLTDVINQKAKSETLANKTAIRYVEMFKDTKPHGEKFNTDYNNVERGMGAFLMRTVIGSAEEMKDEFNRRVKLIQESIDVLSNGDNREKKLAKLYNSVYNSLVSGADNRDDIMSRMDPINLDAVAYWNNIWENEFDRMSEVAEGIYNRKLTKELSYTPDFFKKISEYGDEDELDDLSSTEMAFLQNTGNTFYERSTGRLMIPLKGASLPRSKKNKTKAARYIDMSFDSNNANSYYDALVDMNTAQYIRQVKTFMSEPTFENIVRGSEDRKVLRKRIAQYINNIRNKNPYSGDDDVSKFLRIVNGSATIGAVQALAGVTQPFKQVIPVSINTLLNTKGRLDVSAPFSYDKLMFMMNSGRGIANRGVDSLAEIESLNKIIERAADGPVEDLLDKIQKANKYLLKMFLQKPDMYIAQMSWLSYYEQSLRQQGASWSEVRNIDYASHEINEEAADYAQRQIDRQQNISDHDLAGRIFNPNASGKWKGVHSFMLKTMMPFASFRINQASRLANDLRVLQKWSIATSEDKKLAARSLIGYTAENVVFKTISGGISYLIAKAVLGARGVGDDDEEEYEKELQKKKDFILQYQRAGYAIDILSPNPVFDGLMQSGLHYLIKEIQSMSDTPEDEMFVFPDVPKTDWIKNLGQFGIMVDKALQIKEISELAYDGKFTDKYGRDRWIMKEDQEAMAMLLAPAIFAAIGIGFTEVNSFSKAMIRDAKFAASSTEGGEYRADVANKKIEKKASDEKKQSDKEIEISYLKKALSKAKTDVERNSVYKQIKILKMSKEEKSAYDEKKKRVNAQKKQMEKILLGDKYESKEDMKRYAPEAYKKAFGKNSMYYKKYHSEDWANKKVDEIKRSEEDKKRGYTPKRRRRTED